MKFLLHEDTLPSLVYLLLSEFWSKVNYQFLRESFPKSLTWSMPTHKCTHMHTHTLWAFIIWKYPLNIKGSKSKLLWGIFTNKGLNLCIKLSRPIIYIFLSCLALLDVSLFKNLYFTYRDCGKALKREWICILMADSHCCTAETNTIL